MRLPLFLPTALLPATLLLAAPPSSAQVQDLGTLPLSANSEATDISRDGSVIVGFDSGPMGSISTFAWSETAGFTDLAESLPPLAPYSQSEVLISGDGTVVVAGAFQGSPTSFALRWDLSTGAVLPIVGFALVSAVSDDGSSFAGVSPFFPGTRAARWSETGGFQHLGAPIGTASNATDMSADGSIIVGNMLTSTGPTVPFLWTQGAGTGLVPLTGFVGESRPYVSVSRDGQAIAGVRIQPGMQPRAYRWTAASGITDLGTLAGGEADSFAPLLISDDGSVIAGAESSTSTAALDGWRWTQATGMLRLSPQSNLRPTAMSADGTVISCVEQLSQGQQPWRWTLAGGAVPLPVLEPNLPSTTAAISADGRVIVGISSVAQISAGQFQQNAALWREDGTLGRTVCSPAVPNSTGAPSELRLTGSNRVPNGALTIEATSLPPGAFGFVICSRAEGFATNPGGSQGDLCLSGSIGRYVGPGQTQTANAAGEFSLTIDPVTFIQPNGPVASTYGESWFFQAWHRDTNPTPTSNFSDAATVRFYPD